jgi:hypothetical protein
MSIACKAADAIRCAAASPRQRCSEFPSFVVGSEWGRRRISCVDFAALALIDCDPQLLCGLDRHVGIEVGGCRR